VTSHLGWQAEVIVIGAGSAGLGTAAELGRLGLRVLVLERSSAVGASWRGRYAGLRLNNDRWSARLPRGRIPSRAGRWPAREEFIAYLERYAESNRLDIRFGVEVERIARGDEGWCLQTSDGPLRAPFVVVGTGHDRCPYLPDWPGMAGFAGRLLHAVEFQDAAAFRGQDVLIVGIGTSATEIATRLPSGGVRRVRVAVRTTPNLMPSEFLGIPITVFARLFERMPARLVDRLARIVTWLELGDLRKYGLEPARYGVATELAVKGMGPVIDRGFLDAVEAGQVELVASLEGFDGADVCLADGSRIRPDVVIAATGYRSGLEGLVGHLGVLTPSGEPAALGADTDAATPGLYFNGYRLPLSGELSGIRRDARRIARAIAAGRPRGKPVQRWAGSSVPEQGA
jgi:cation diffusion facilitator CzcD-associated flavoprotein CzcO